MIFLLLVLCVAGYLVGRLRWRRCRWLLHGLALLLFLAAACGPLPAWLLDHLQASYATRPDITSEIVCNKQAAATMANIGRDW